MKNAPFDGNPWTYPESTALLKACGDRRIPREEWMEIAKNLGTGRTVAACKQQVVKLRAHDRCKKKQQNAGVRRELQEPPRHTSLTAAIFGDPPPGRSALDQRMAGRC